MRILLVEDHGIVRSGLREMLSATIGAECSEAADADAALAAIAEKRPDLVLLDLNLPGLGGIALLPQLRAMGLRVLVLTMITDGLYASRALEAGALGYVSKNVSSEELLAAIRAVAAGRRYIEHRLAQDLALHSVGAGGNSPRLTERDMEIMRLLAGGRSLTEIATIFGVAYKTVANTAGQLRTKLGVARTADLIRLAVEMQAERGRE